MVGPSYTGLALGGWPGQEVVPELDILDASDTWSLAATEASSRVPIDPKACADTWTLAVDDETRRGQILDLPWWYTDVGPLLVSIAPNALTGSAAPNLLPVVLSDTYSLSWTEGPVDTRLADVWDSMLLTVGDSYSLFSRQDYPASEYWFVTLIEPTPQISSSSSQRDWSASDPWNLTLATESAALWKDPSASEDWSVTFSLEASLLLNVADVTDDWTATLSEETGLPEGSGVFDVPAAESWALRALDSYALMRTSYPAIDDAWSIRYSPEGGAVISSGTMDLSDLWDLKAIDDAPVDIKATPMESDLEDTWGVMLQSEVAVTDTILDVPVIGGDQLTLSCTEICFVTKGHIRPPAHRRIKISRRRTPVTVDE